jgi:hypothetical protein
LKGDRPLDHSIAECEVVLIAVESGFSRGPIIVIIAGLLALHRSLLKPYFGLALERRGDWHRYQGCGPPEDDIIKLSIQLLSQKRPRLMQ